MAKDMQEEKSALGAQGLETVFSRVGTPVSSVLNIGSARLRLNEMFVNPAKDASYVDYLGGRDIRVADLDGRNAHVYGQENVYDSHGQQVGEMIVERPEGWTPPGR